MEQPQETPNPQQEESIFNEADYSMEGYDKHIKNARVLLFIIAGLQLLPILLMGQLSDQAKVIVVTVSVAEALIFAALALWTKRQPYPALLTAFIFYLLLLVVFAILDPQTIYQGLIVKIVVIILLVLGIRNAKEAKDLKETFGK